MNISESIIKALGTINKALGPLRGEWLVGGSCGLLLQRIPLKSEPGDLDIYIDEPYVENVFLRLEPFAVDRPHYSETAIYRSCLSHYTIEDVQVELVGGFQVTANGTTYQTEVGGWLNQWSIQADLEELRIPLTPLAHEFVFNFLRDRPDRYVPIAETMRSGYDVYIPALKGILKRNHFSDTHLRRFGELLHCAFT